MTVLRRLHRTALTLLPRSEAATPLAGAVRALGSFVLAAAVTAPAGAQGLPSRPVTLLDGRLSIGASVSVSFAPSDDRAYYNLTEYNSSLLRMVQVSFDSTLQIGSRAEAVFSLNGLTPVDGWNWNAYPSSAFLSVRPFAGRTIAVRGGIVPPAFGAFMSRAYGNSNLLIGYPLAYHYATTVRTDAFPVSADELLRRRGFGAVSHFSLGDVYREPGLPLVNPFGWNPGVGVTAGDGPLDVSVALTRGGIAAGRRPESTTGWQLSGRVEAHPQPSLVLGISGAYGSYVEEGSAALVRTASFNRHPHETALGLDAEYSRGYWLVRGEAIFNRRTVPAFAAPYLSSPLWTGWVGIETRYKLFPGMYVAGRLERLSFGGISGSTASDTWDADVTRVEAGGGYALMRNLTFKLSYQRNQRDTRYYPHQQLVAGQVVMWF